MASAIPQNDPISSRKIRASKPKVKSGCVTCKARRVKCDETKPDCLRCSNFGRKCGGYPSKDDALPSKDPTPVIRRRLLSKPPQVAGPSMSSSPEPSQMNRHLSLSPSRNPVILSLRVPGSLPPGVVFQEELDYQCFCHFRDVTAIEFSGGFDPAFWRSFVLQACEDPSILQLTVATAAMSIAVRGISATLRDQQKDAHHQYALQQYGRALKGIRERVATTQDSTRIALLSALLIFCFENLQNDLDRVMIHIQSALEMIVKHLSNAPQLHYFSRLGLPAQSHGTIDADILTAFMRLDGPYLTLMIREKGFPPVPANRIFNILFASEQYEIPSALNTIAEARTYLEDITSRILPNDQPSGPLAGFWNDGADLSTSVNFESALCHLKQWYQASGILNSSSLLSIRLGQWHDAFSPILNYAMTQAGEALFAPAVILHIQALSADLIMTGFFSPSYSRHRSSSFSNFHTASSTGVSSADLSGPSSSSLTVPDSKPSQRRSTSQRSSPVPSSDNTSLFPTVHAILDFSRRLISHPQFFNGFVFEIGIIPSIVSIFMLCPDRILRRDAVGVLRLMSPRREGIWDSNICANVGEKYLNRDCGQPELSMVDPALLNQF